MQSINPFLAIDKEHSSDFKLKVGEIVSKWNLEDNSEPKQLYKALKNQISTQTLAPLQVMLEKRIATLYFESSNYEKALYHFKDALRIAKENKFTELIISSSASLAIVYYQLGLYKESLRLNLANLDLAIENNSPNGIVNTSLAIVNVYLKDEEYEKAIASLKIAESHINEHGIKLVGYIDFCIISALCYQKVDKLKVSLSFLEKAKKALNDNSIVSTFPPQKFAELKSFYLNNKTECLLAANRIDEALNVGNEALNFISQNKVRPNRRFNCYFNLGQILYHKNELIDSVNFLKKSVEIDRDILVDKSKAYSLLIKGLILSGFQEEAVDYLDKREEDLIEYRKLLKQFEIRRFEYLREINEVKIELKNERASNRKIRELNLSLQDFANTASHDLMEPLRTIGSFAHLLSKEIKESRIGRENVNLLEYLQFINTGVVASQKMLKSLFLFSKLDFEKLDVNLVDLNHVINQVLNNLDNQISRSRAIVNVQKLPNNLLSVEPLLIILFQNIISNCLKFVNESNIPTINITSNKKGEIFEIIIKDNGIGIPKDKLDHIFKAFTKLNDRTKYEGSGLGLAICKKILLKLGGDILVKSKVEEGTEFRVVLINLDNRFN